MSTEVMRARSKLARLFANGGKPDPEIEAAARAELAEAKVKRCIQQEAEPLTAEQRARLARMLLNDEPVDKDVS